MSLNLYGAISRESIWHADRKIECAQCFEFLPPPLRDFTGMHDQKAIGMTEAGHELRQMRRISPPITKIVDSGEAFVGVQPRGAQIREHAGSEECDRGGFEPGQLSFPEFGQLDVGIAKVRSGFPRKSPHKVDHTGPDSGQLMRMKMSINKIRPSAAFLNELRVLNVCFRGNFPGLNLSEDGSLHKIPIRRQFEPVTASRRGHVQGFIRQAKMQADVHARFMCSQVLEERGTAPVERGSTRDGAQFSASAELENGVIDVVAKSKVVSTDDHLKGVAVFTR